MRTLTAENTPQIKSDKNVRETNDGKDEMLNTTRLAAGALAVVAAVSAAKGISEVPKAFDNVKNYISSNAHQASEMSKFDHILGKDSFSESKVRQSLQEEGVSPTDVTMHTVTAQEANPTEVAKDMNAKDVTLVSGEVAGQVGGDRSMQAGEIVAIPNDQLK
jgi:hypothetical protein